MFQDRTFWKLFLFVRGMFDVGSELSIPRVKGMYGNSIRLSQILIKNPTFCVTNRNN